VGSWTDSKLQNEPPNFVSDAQPIGHEGGARYRTTVLVSVRISPSFPNSYQLFERCAGHLSSIRSIGREGEELLPVSIGYS
jgi:hypothetical protein